ncbi:hypothetical protein LAZ67_10001128, partial [Cordylochernes scorpioides]
MEMNKSTHFITLPENLCHIATILNGKHQRKHIQLPHIPMIPTDIPFEFKRLQFPVLLAFAKTINKAQGQSLQLYFGCSRVGKPSNLLVPAPDSKTKNAKIRVISNETACVAVSNKAGISVTIDRCQVKKAPEITAYHIAA